MITTMITHQKQNTNQSSLLFKFFRRNKRGIELTINFIVMLILGIAMLSGAIILTTKLFGKAKQYQSQVDANTQAEIKKMITSTNDQVVIYPSRKTVGRKESATFGVGVQNTIKGGGKEDEFTVGVQFARSYNKDKQTTCDNADIGEGLDKPCKSLPSTWPKQGTFQKIKKNEVKSFPVPITVTTGTLSGIYVFDVRVCKRGMDANDCNKCASSPGCSLYDDLVHKIYVNVE